MIFAIGALLLGPSAPTGYDQVIAPYVSCLERRRNEVVARNDLIAGSELEAEAKQEKLTAEVRRMCARERRLARKHAISITKASKNPTRQDLALVDSLLTYADGLFTPILVVVPQPVSQAANAPN